MKISSLFRTFLPAVFLLAAGVCPAFAAQQAENTAEASAAAAAVQGLPQTYADFKTRCQTAALTPEGAVKMYFDAVFCYLDPDRREEASKMLRYIMHADAGWEKSQKYVTFIRRLKEPAYHHIFRSFAAGTSPENGYGMSPDNYTLIITKKDKQQDYIRVFLRSSGADTDRRLWVKQYDGFWYVINNADSYVMVREPAMNNNSHDADFDVSPAPQPAQNPEPSEPSETAEPSAAAEIQPEPAANAEPNTEPAKAQPNTPAQAEPAETAPANDEPAENDGSEMSTW